MSLDWSPLTLQAWGIASLIFCTLIAVESDQRVQRIPNSLVIATLCIGLALHTLGPVNTRDGLFDNYPGALGFWPSLLGMLTGLLIFLPLHLVRAMGAGDVKFMAAMGAYTGPSQALILALCILIAGGVMSISLMWWRHQSRAVLGQVRHIFSSWLHGQAPMFDARTQSVYRMPYALAFALGLSGFLSLRMAAF